MSRLIQALFLGILAAMFAPTFAPGALDLGKDFFCGSGETFSYEGNAPVCRAADGTIAADSTGAIPWWVGGIAFVAAYGVLGLFRRRRNKVSDASTISPALNLSKVQITETDKAEIQKMVREGNLIQAIKKAREVTGLGLKEAKDLVDGNFSVKVVHLTPPTGFMGTSAPQSAVESLESLKEMLDKGLVSQVEFETKKKEILNRM
jgi:hypothetical protein